MKLLVEISEETLGIGEGERLGENYELGKSARAILIDEEGNMATQHLRNHKYHKLPGGGLDPGETTEEALKREIMEEVGCDCEVLQPIGMTIEYRNKFNLIYISYAFAAKVLGEIGEPQLEQGEIDEGQVTLWLSPTEVLEKMKSDNPERYNGHFILKREISFLEEYLKN